MDTQSLLIRLNEIGRSLEQSDHALALIGLGSVGLELDRLDCYSDLDFFAIVEAGYKHTYLDSLQWLSGVHPIAYSFPNTEDGYKILFADGIFCEFAVFEPAELEHIPLPPVASSGNERMLPTHSASQYLLQLRLLNTARVGCWAKH